MKLRQLAVAFAEVVVALLAIYTLVFCAWSLAPDPARALLGPNASAESLATLQSRMGLDRPWPVRYTHLLRAIVTGDLGQSPFFGMPVERVVLQNLPLTLGRAVAALLLGSGSGAAVALIGSRWRGVRQGLIILIAVPSFCLVLIVLSMVVAIWNETPLSAPRLYGMLTVVVGAAVPFGAVGLFLIERTRCQGSSARSVEFLHMLGLPSWYIQRVAWREGLRPAIGVAFNCFGAALTGVVLAEVIFGTGGFGRIFLRACERGELAVAMAGTLALAAVLLVGQRVTDAITIATDPRLDNV